MPRHANDHPRRASEPQPDLARRYGSIGIPAVAAAARYQGQALNPEPVPAAPPARQPEDAAT